MNSLKFVPGCFTYSSSWVKVALMMFPQTKPGIYNIIP